MKRKKFVAFTITLLWCAMFAMPDAREAFSINNETGVVIVDAGHGGIDGGAVSISGAPEKKLNLEISERLSDMLSFMGVETCMTRVDDNSVNTRGSSVRQQKISDMNTRVEQVNKIKNAYLISIHMNHFSQQNCSGAQVFYSNDETSERIAASVQEKLKYGLDKNNKRTPQKAGKNIFLLNKISCPGVLVECGFLSNPTEEQLLKTSNYQKRIALSITIGFLDSYKDVLNYENKDGFCV